MKVNSINNINFSSIKLKGDFKKFPTIQEAFEKTDIFNQLGNTKDKYIARLTSIHKVYPPTASHEISIQKTFLGLFTGKETLIRQRGCSLDGATSAFIHKLSKY